MDVRKSRPRRDVWLALAIVVVISACLPLAIAVHQRTRTAVLVDTPRVPDGVLPLLSGGSEPSHAEADTTATTSLTQVGTAAAQRDAAGNITSVSVWGAPDDIVNRDSAGQITSIQRAQRDAAGNITGISVTSAGHMQDLPPGTNRDLNIPVVAGPALAGYEHLGQVTSVQHDTEGHITGITTTTGTVAVPAAPYLDAAGRYVSGNPSIDSLCLVGHGTVWVTWPAEGGVCFEDTWHEAVVHMLIRPEQASRQITQEAPK